MQNSYLNRIEATSVSGLSEIEIHTKADSTKRR